MPISLLSRFIPVGNQNINRFVKSVGIMRVQGDQSLENFNVAGDSNIAFIIGGAFGLSDDVKNQADILLSISKMTLPHLMVRGFLIEQIYRASTIISNHPYHKN
jgi:rRNA large subunit m3Psi methyltransferase RlmH